MELKFNIGDEATHIVNRPNGICLKFYQPISCSEQTTIVIKDGRKYHAQTNAWAIKTSSYPDNNIIYVKVIDNVESNNPYENYLRTFAKNHGMDIEDARNEPMVKARLDYYLETGM